MRPAWLAAVLGWALFWSIAEAAPTQAGVDFYIATYGAIDPSQDPRAATAFRVFDKVKAAADKSIKRMPRLVVISGATDAWAIALPSGHIVLSRKALELCFKSADPATAEARLAFILGHELAHLAHDDYWHHEVESFLAKTQDTQKIAHFLDQSFEARQAELAADDKGYLYAAMAGYPVERLVDNRKTDFFTFWMQQTQAKITSSHPFPEDRAALLRERLKMLQEKLAFFDMGVRLAHFGRCADAMYFLQEFKRVFPEPAVLNNLGVCALQLALQQMPKAQAGFYWLPFLLDLETRAPRTRGVAAEPEPARRFLKDFEADSSQAQSHLKEAAEYLGQAVAAAPDYLAARLNLATVQLYQGRPHQARATLDEALDLAKSDWQVKMLDALALYEQSEAGIDLWPAAIKRLEVFDGEMPPAWRYNLARLFELRPRPQEAQDHWNRLAQAAAQLPAPIRNAVCAKQSLQPAAACLNPAPQDTVSPLPWRWPVSTEGAMPLTPSLRAKLFQGWESIPFDWLQAKLYGFIHRSPDRRAEVMETDQFIQLQVIKQDLGVALEQLPKLCSRPLLRHRLLHGELLTCDHWAVLARDGRAVEAWWIAP
jgi:tetratricopeptide (TPR) repeat protein